MTDETAGIGHNSIDTLGQTAQGKLTAIVERIERLNEEKRELTEDIGEVFAEAKGEGFDTPIIRKVIAIRAMDPAKRAETQALIDTYLEALGSL